MYIPRHIDNTLREWKEDPRHKPLLLRGARQVGKSRSIRKLGESFEFFIEVNFEKRPELMMPFKEMRDVHQVAQRISSFFQIPVEAGRTLLFLDEIQACEEALKALWFFKEDFPELHVIAAGSLLEFALKNISGYGVGRIRSIFMYPLSFDEFLVGTGKGQWLQEKSKADSEHPVFEAMHKELQQHFRTFLLVGGMPAAVSAWIETKDYMRCAEELEDIQQTYYDDFAKYAPSADPHLLRSVLQSIIMQTGKKFMYSRVSGGYKPDEIKSALSMLSDAGIVKNVRYSSGNGLPLGAETNSKFNKFIYLDSGLLLRTLDLELGGGEELRRMILLDDDAELVNKGSITEMTVGWELVKYSSARIQHDLYYWENLDRGATAEVDYLTACDLKVLPIEVKSGISGKMKSLRLFMEKKRLSKGVRTSLENFGRIESEINGTTLMIDIIPLYAISNLFRKQYRLETNP